ncbi:hypothetical protein [uncultured Roseobacter sp.]|uniref:hypothetical protein n=1 Tax=uncultured Roseobacter sp. TaxID=114847 RepID=UPI0026364DF5|nr:hypothetical protein [uncultured Roseobacter sp.]
MEARVAKLEAAFDYMRGDVSDLKGDMKNVRDRMRAVEVKIDHLPSKGFIVWVVIAALTAIAAMIGYAADIQALLANQ